MQSLFPSLSFTEPFAAFIMSCIQLPAQKLMPAFQRTEIPTV